MKISVSCNFCGKLLVRYAGSKVFYCDITCKSKQQSKQGISIEVRQKISASVSGSKNPNFNNRWSAKQKEIASLRLKEAMKDPIRRYNSGKANRGQKFSKDRVLKMHKHRSKDSYSHPHTSESKKVIGEKSKKKWTPEYKRKNRKTQEDAGHFIPLHIKDDYQLYFEFADWNQRMFDLITNTNQKSILQELGVFNSKSNRQGVVRDHMLSRRTGFELGIFPEILRHPCNCQLIQHSANTSKRFKGDDITYSELFKRIQNYTGEWHEHSACLMKIQEFLEGKRYTKEQYIAVKLQYAD